MDDAKQVGEIVRDFLAQHPDVTNPALVLHGVLEAHPELRDGREIDLASFGPWVQHCEEEVPE